MASMYAVYHGREGLELIAQRVHRLTAILARGLRDGGLELVHDDFFDTIRVRVPVPRRRRHRGRRASSASTCCGSTPTPSASRCDEVTERAAGRAPLERVPRRRPTSRRSTRDMPDAIPAALARSSDFLSAPGVQRAPLRDADAALPAQLAGRDVALDRAMIPLGSCTMKLNATTEMQAVSWPEFSTMHPFAPLDRPTATSR